MTILTEDNFDQAFSPSVRDIYWQRVEEIIVDVLQDSSELVTEYRKRIEEAPIEEQILTFHEPPLHVALDLTGTHGLSVKQTTIYERKIEAWSRNANESGNADEKRVALSLPHFDSRERRLPVRLKLPIPAANHLPPRVAETIVMHSVSRVYRIEILYSFRVSYAVRFEHEGAAAANSFAWRHAMKALWAFQPRFLKLLNQYLTGLKR